MEQRAVFWSHSMGAIKIAQSLLDADGIRMDIRNEFLSGARPEVGVHAIEIWVAEKDAERATEILSEFHDVPESNPAKAWTCAKCGEVMEEQFTACWRCRTERNGG